jgi:hypothetical protein
MIDHEIPTYVSILLYTIYGLLLVSVVLTGWSMVRGLRLQGKEGGWQNGVPARRIAFLTVALLVVTMAITWLIGSTKSLSINGKTFSDAFWLKTSDMLIATPIVLIIALGVISVASMLKKK